MKPTLLKVDNPAYLPQTATLRNTTTGDMMVVTVRRSGTVQWWPYTRSGRTGNPWSRQLSEEMQERLDRARDVWGRILRERMVDELLVDARDA